MADRTFAFPKSWSLRHRAEARLRAGTAPPAAAGYSTGVEALTLLHLLASTPATAGDALKLLHELQVHQVELDLQQEQLEDGQRELADALDRYVELYDFAPVGYFTLDSEFKIVEGNWAGARLFGVDKDHLGGRRIASFLTPESGQVLLALLKRLQVGGAGESCEVQSSGNAVATCVWQVASSVSPGGEQFLTAFTDASGHRQTGHPE